MRQQKLRRDLRNPYLHHIYKQLVRTLDTETLKQKLERKKINLNYDDDLLIKAHRAIPNIQKASQQKQSKIQQKNLYNKRQIFEKIVCDNKFSRRNDSNHNNSRLPKRNMLSNKFIIAYHTLQEGRAQKSLDLQNTLKNKKSSLKERSLQVINGKQTSKQKSQRYLIANYPHNKSASPHKNRKIINNAQELKINQKQISSKRYQSQIHKTKDQTFLPSMPTIDKQGSNLLQNGKLLTQFYNRQTPTRHFEDHNFIFKAKPQQQSEGSQNDFVTKQQKNSVIKNLANYSSLQPITPVKKPRRQFVKKFDWKTESFPNNMQKITKDQFQSLIRGYLNLGSIIQIPYGFFKAYVGPGNNSAVIKKALKDRGYWLIVNSLDENPNFVWTQIHNQNFSNKKNEQQCQNILNIQNMLKQQNIDQKINDKQWNMLMDTQTQQFINIKKNDLLVGCQKIMKKQYYNKYMKLICDKFKMRYNISYLSQIKKNIFNFYRKIPHSNSTILKSSQILLHNHIQGANAIANKKCLFYYLIKYCQLFQQNPWNFIPQTIHINDQWTQQEILNKLPHGNSWLIKPGQFTNRGQGITIHNSHHSLFQQIRNIHQEKKKHKSGAQYTSILQQYIEPLLYNGRKFDIRVWVLWSGGQVWWYQQGYVRTSCKQFSNKSTNKYIHLTNDAIQSQCPDYGKYEPANKVSFSELQKYLQINHNFHNFNDQIVEQMKQITIKMFRVGGLLFDQSYLTKLDRKYYDFQLFGLDFLLDQNLKPWLIQCNSNPCLQVNCSLLSRLVPNMIDNMLSLTVDCFYPPTLKKKPKQPVTWSQQSFKFQLLYDFVQDKRMWQQKLYRKLEQIEFSFSFHKQAQKQSEQFICQQNQEKNKQ